MELGSHFQRPGLPVARDNTWLSRTLAKKRACEDNLKGVEIGRVTVVNQNALPTGIPVRVCNKLYHA